MMRFLQTHSLKLILALGLLHGLLYVFLVPPWQHNDEPTHFEYAWLLVNRPEFPQPGDYDQGMRREVALSMIEHGFFRGMNFVPDLNIQDEPVWLGISQLDNRPFYYILTSLPLRLIKPWDVTLQLYAARLVSLALYLLTLASAWGLMKELLPDGHPLRWMVPLSMALLPGFTDLMTALNDDVGATALFSLFLWGSVRLIRQGFSFPRLLWTVGAALLCGWTKQTVFLALPLLGLALLLVLFRKRWGWIPWAALVIILPIGLVAIFSWGDEALFWVRAPDALQESSTRTLSAEAKPGDHILQMKITPGEPASTFFQLLPSDQVITLRGKTVTLGAWIWATQPVNGRALVLYDGRSHFSQTFQIDTFPKFFSFSATLAEDANRMRVILSPVSQDKQLTVFYDGLTLVEGAHPLEIPPQFDGPAAQQGTWAGQTFTNLLRNASAENSGPGVRPWAKRAWLKIFPYIPISLATDSFLDWKGAGWYYQTTLQTMLRTFWAKFGWGHVPLSIPFTDRPYRLLTAITLVGIGGAMLTLWRKRLSLPWHVLLFLGLTLAGIWGQAVLRGVHSLTDTIFIPGARYAYPAIIPTLLALNAGWLEIARPLDRWLRLPPIAKYMVYFLLFLGLDVAAIASIIRFYTVK